MKKFKIVSRTCKFIDPYSLEVLKEKNRTNKEIFISIGMGRNKQKISKIFKNKKIIFCYCIPKYPLEFKKINWNDAVKYDGFSDHTMDILALFYFPYLKNRNHQKEFTLKNM